MLPVTINVCARDGGRRSEDWMKMEAARRGECVFTLVSCSSWAREILKGKVGELRVREYAGRCVMDTW
jgi:hypothetical protein